MDNNYLQLDTELLSFSQIKDYIENNRKVAVTEAARKAIEECRNYLDKKIKDSEALFYGINTGFGFLQNVKIDKEQLNKLQDNLIKSHSCGMGEEVPSEIVRLMLMLKIKSLSYGYSGVSLEIVGRLAEMHNENVLPVVYTKGSLGASGDLAPLSHLSLPLIGLGEVVFNGQKGPSSGILKAFDWEPLILQSKEGLALINGTQFMSAYGMYCLVFADRLLQWADVIATVSMEAYQCNIDFLNEHIHKIRPHQGQSDTAATIRKYLKGSSISSREKQQVQDPYSFRCIPQVHGASKDTFDFVLKTFLTEINSVTDNPNIFPDDDLILSGGNFHGQPLALVLDYLAIAMSELGSISERRSYQLLSGSRGLPLFLVHNHGLNSGLMIPQYTAASLVSENKQLCTPASVDSITSSNNQEDHVSMGANAATKCLKVLMNLEQVLAIELLTACQALDFVRPLKSSDYIENLFSAYRKIVSFNETDRVLHEDMVRSVQFMKTFEL